MFQVLNVISGLSIHYAARDLSNIITEHSLNEYNNGKCKLGVLVITRIQNVKQFTNFQVFRFLLAIKWGLWTLENLRFTRPKRHSPYAELTISALISKRLALVRQWILYSIQCIHSHLMTYILSIMGEQLDRKVRDATNLMELLTVHRLYVESVTTHCFQTSSDTKVCAGVKQLLDLTTALRNEWQNICYITDELDGCLSVDDSSSQLNSRNESNIDGIEGTYINCHSALAKLLSTEVYTRNRTHCECVDGWAWES